MVVKPKELQVGFSPETGKTDSVQYIPISETLKILLSKEDIFVYHIEQQNSVTANFNLSQMILSIHFRMARHFMKKGF